MREEPAPRLVHAWYASALLLESWYTSALLLESTQLLEICNPHSNEAEMAHGSNAVATICTVHCPCPACRRAIAALARLQPWARVFHGSIGQSAICSYLCSNRVHIIGIQHKEHCYNNTAATTVHSCTANLLSIDHSRGAPQRTNQ